jgi:hypothetical protein
LEEVSGQLHAPADFPNTLKVIVSQNKSGNGHMTDCSVHGCKVFSETVFQVVVFWVMML